MGARACCSAGCRRRRGWTSWMQTGVGGESLGIWFISLSWFRGRPGGLGCDLRASQSASCAHRSPRPVCRVAGGGFGGEPDSPCQHVCDELLNSCYGEGQRLLQQQPACFLCSLHACWALARQAVAVCLLCVAAACLFCQLPHPSTYCSSRRRPDALWVSLHGATSLPCLPPASLPRADLLADCLHSATDIPPAMQHAYDQLRRIKNSLRKLAGKEVGSHTQTRDLFRDGLPKGGGACAWAQARTACVPLAQACCLVYQWRRHALLPG